MADALPRTFVSFSSADIHHYRLMCAWKEHEHIDFNFADFQLDEAINSFRPGYIKDVCRRKIRRVDTFVLLIGADTHTKTVFVKDEVEAAIEKGCRLIAVNLDNWTRMNPATCPAFIVKAGAVFTSFSPHILKWALDTWQRPKPQAYESYFYEDWVYQHLGYTLNGVIATRPEKPNPFTGGSRPPWAR